MHPEDESPKPPEAAPETAPEPERTDFPIVGIGASAGGLEALEGLVRRLGADGMAYVVVQHLTPGGEAVLVSLLARFTSLPVKAVEDGQKVERGTVYVAAPGSELVLEQGVLKTVAAAPRPALRHPIDYFFRSLAVDRGTAAIGVILSGSGTDGTLGLRAIKEGGGITFAQDPATAVHRSMPQSARDSGFVDLCLSPVEIGDELMRISAHPYLARVRPRAFGRGTLARIFVLLRSAFGVDFSGYKSATIERRVERRMTLQRIETLDDYLDFLEKDPKELTHLYRDLLIGVTSFFRDRAPFEALKDVVFPRLLERRPPETPLRIWVAGCASGEEAYSVAMCLLEYLGDRALQHRIQIFATDIDTQALSRARYGLYPQNIELDVSPERLQRFFVRRESGYQISRQVRELIMFAQHDVTKDPPFARIDLVTCRNVLIYMQASLQRRVQRILHYSLSPDGFLLLGLSETTGDTELFTLVDQKLKIFVKKNVPSSLPVDAGFDTLVLNEVDAGLPPRPARTTVSVQQLAERLVAEKFGPPGVVINEKLEVLYFRGRTAPYIEQPSGAATLNLLKLIRPELLIELRAAIHKVLADGLPVTTQPIAFTDTAGARRVVIEVFPLHQAGAPKVLFAIFNEAAKPVAPAEAAEPAKPEDRRILELERELALTKEYLQATIEQLETTNEELMSSNEELQSANEEYQSSNEELSTAKEELQSSNEELSTVNDELHHRMEQLNASNDDLEHLLSVSPAAWLMVGRDLTIRRYSLVAQKLFGLIPADVGRSVSSLKTLVPVTLERIVSSVIETNGPREQSVRCMDGAWYVLRVAPYDGPEGGVGGAILELSKTWVAPKAGEPEGSDWGSAFLAARPDSLLVLDDKLRVFWVNKAFLATFGMEADVVGKTFEELYRQPVGAPETWAMIEDAAAGGRPFRDRRVERPLGRTDLEPMLWDATCIPAERGRPALALITMRAAKE